MASPFARYIEQRTTLVNKEKGVKLVLEAKEWFSAQGENHEYNQVARNRFEQLLLSLSREGYTRKPPINLLIDCTIQTEYYTGDGAVPVTLVECWPGGGESVENYDEEEMDRYTQGVVRVLEKYVQQAKERLAS